MCIRVTSSSGLQACATVRSVCNGRCTVLCTLAKPRATGRMWLLTERFGAVTLRQHRFNGTVCCVELREPQWLQRVPTHEEDVVVGRNCVQAVY